MTPADVPAGPVVVDTVVFSLIHHGKGRAAEWEALLQGHILMLSFATVGELRAWPLVRGWGAKRLAALNAAIDRYVVLTPNDRAASIYSVFHAAAHNALKKGGVNDMWTAACAVAFGPFPVATDDIADFGRIRDLSGVPFPLVHPDL